MVVRFGKMTIKCSIILIWGFFLMNELFTAQAAQCRDTTNWDSWCRTQKCSNGEKYPITASNNQRLFDHCKKACKICKSESLCGDGYYGTECKPCTVPCTQKPCERPGECPQTCGEGYYGYSCDRPCGPKCSVCKRWTGDCDECEVGRYGVDCSSRCSANCVDETCDIEDGSCTYGCKPMYQGLYCNNKIELCDKCHRHDCDQNKICRSGCIPGRYGPKCLNRCSRNCSPKICEQSSGNCSSGCKGTYFGAHCDKQCTLCKNKNCTSLGKCLEGCKKGYYGPFCSNNCSSNCVGRRCDDKTGKCKYCIEGQYGTDCNQDCHPNCSDGCFRRSGKCRSCKSGWFGMKCDGSCSNCKGDCERNGMCKLDCKPSWYGERCEKKCSGCQNGLCSKTSGHCTQGCSVGFYGPECNTQCKKNCLQNVCHQDSGNCKQGCVDTWHGPDCSLKCSSNCLGDLCALNSQNESECQDGCIQGKRGSYCQKPCPENCYNCTDDSCLACKDGFYGLSCAESCSSNCFGPCVKDTGHCTACRNRFFGISCESACSPRCKEASSFAKICDFHDGRCLGGCVQGFYGSICNQSCSENCLNETCDRMDGACTEGCLDGWKGLHCKQPCPGNCSKCNDHSCQKCKPGWYDLPTNCSKACSSTCKNAVCNSDGVCSEGCIAAYYGRNCSLPCIDNCNKCNRTSGDCLECMPTWFGSSCLKQCLNCAEGTCNRESGYCLLGCSAGYFGDKCLMPCGEYCHRHPRNHLVYCEQNSGRCKNGCTNGKYGDMCVQNCSNSCFAGICQQDQGRCEYGCKSNKYGSFCDKNCSATCGTDREGSIQCRQADGMCIQGCQSGWYGVTCTLPCPVGCSEGLCNQTFGICQRCSRGFTGDKCDIACPPGFYGYNCSRACGSCKNNATCDRLYGNCTAGCSEGFAGELCVEKLILAPASTPESNSLTIILVVIGIALLAVTLVIVFFVYKRRKATLERKKQRRDYLMLKPTENSVSNPSYSHSPRVVPSKALRTTPKKNGSIHGQNGHTMADVHLDNTTEGDDAYYNLVNKDLSTRVRTEDLWNQIQMLKQTDGYKDQYDKLPTGLIHTVDAAMLPENKSKNRYKNICAFDRSRVVLEKEEGDPFSDYINANYVSGYNSPDMFIASQGPVDLIINDFWRMIWGKGVSKVVMLTNMVEEGRMKCVLYWPEVDAGPVQYGNLSVECTVQDVLAHFTVRTFRVKKVKSKSSNIRIVKHFHFTSWPDKGVPTDVASLVEFYFKVKNTPVHGNGPMVVHCSAGIGRTGTFLALAYLMQEVKESDTVDPFSCVQKMRHERVNMVQTLEQYEFLHLALVEAMMAGGTTIPAAMFTATYQDLLGNNTETGVQKLEELFETLQLMSPPYRTEEYRGALFPENMDKNRFNEILASDYYRPFLSTRFHGRTDYINAVYLPAYKEKKAFILTQMPLQETVIDFWRMILETDSETIVMLNDDHDDQQTVGYYWPQKNRQKDSYGPFVVEMDGEKDFDYYKVLTLKVARLNETSDTITERTVKLFQCHFWPQGQTTPDTAFPVLSLMEDVDIWLRGTQHGPVTVHCLDGVERSGLYCVLSAILERLKIEQDVSILQTINQMRVCRPQLIQGQEQFKFLYAAVQDYLDKFSTYSNFS